MDLILGHYLAIDGEDAVSNRSQLNDCMFIRTAHLELGAAKVDKKKGKATTKGKETKGKKKDADEV